MPKNLELRERIAFHDVDGLLWEQRVPTELKNLGLDVTR